MGSRTTKDRLIFVAFGPEGSSFRPTAPIHSIEVLGGEANDILRRAAGEYRSSIKRMRSVLDRIEAIRKSGRRLPARLVWRLGNEVFLLVHNIRSRSMEIDDLYSHLVRDLGVKRKWLEKVLTFRRYIIEQKQIPDSLSWGSCEKGTARKAKLIGIGKPSIN